MANDNRIDLIARVNVEESAQQIIKEDLTNLQTKINEKGGIKIDCSIDTKNFDVLRKQISEFSKGLKIDVSGLNIGSNKFGLDIAPTREEIRQLEKDLDLVFDKRKTGKYADDLRQEFASLIDDYKDSFTKALDSGEFTKTNNAYQKLIDFVIKYRREIDTTNEALAEQKNLIKSITASTLADGQKATTYIDSRLKAELDSMTGGIAGDNKKILDNVFGVGGWTYDRSKSFNTFDSVAEELRSIPSLQNLDSNYIEAFRQVIGLLNGSLSETNDMIELIERETESELYTTLGNFLNNILLPIVEAHNNLTESKDTPEFVSEDTIKNLDTVENKLETIVATEKEVQELMNTKTDVNMEYPSLLSSKNTKETLENAKRQLNELEIPATRITRAIEDSTGQLIAFDVQVEKEDKSIEKLRYRLNEAGDGFEYLYKTIREADNATDLRKKPIEVSVGIKTSELDTFIKKVEDSGVPIEKFTYSVDDLKKSLSDVGNVDIGFDAGKFNAFQDKFAIAKAEFKSLQNEMRIASKDQSFENRLKKLSAQMQVFENANEKAVTSLKKMSDGKTFAQGWEDLKESLNTSNLNADGLKHINEQLATFKAEANSAGLTSSSFFKNMGEQIAQVASQYLSLYAAINTVEKAIDNVINLDTAMTNLKKVTDETDETYERFLDDADKQAKELHSTISDIVTQTSEWAKLGYGLDEARQLANSSMIYSNVGEVDNQTAVSDLITSMKAFNVEAENSIELVDKFNILGNNFATDAKSIGEGLRVSASTLATAGNDLEQSLALLTGGTEITQNATEMGNALRVISLRLRGMKGELQELNEDTEGLESISKIQTQILNLTGNQVNIFDANKNFKSTYDILKDIASIYDKLSNTAQADLTEILFGKNRANQGIAILQAFQSGQIEKAYETAVDSAGSAQAEFDKWSESIEAHMNSFKEAWENLSKDLVSSKAIKTGIDIGTKFIDILDLLVSKGTVFKAVISSIAIAKFGSQIYSLAGTVATLVTQLDLAEIAANGLSVALKGMLGIGIPTAIILIAQYLSTLNDEQERYNELAEEQKAKSIEATSTYKSESDTLENITVQYTQILTTTTDINTAKEKLQALQDQLVATYGEEATGIDFVNGKYSEQIGLLRDLNKEKSEEYVRSNTGSYNQAIDYLANADNAVYKDVFKELSNYNLEPIKAYIDLEILNTGDVKQQLIELDKLIENAVDLGITTDSITQIQKIRNELSENIKTADELKSTYEEATNAIKNKNAVPDNIQKAFDIYVEQAKSIGAALTEAYNIGDADSIERLKNMLKIVQTETYKTINGYEELESTADVVFTNIGDKEKYIADAIEFSNKSFSELLTNFKESKQDIDLIEESLQKMANGETISSSDAWKIIEMDTAGILNNIKSINGEYQFSMEELIKLKDTYVGKIQDSIRGTSATLKTQLGVLTTALSDAERQLRNYTVNSQSDIAHYIELRQNVQNYKQLVGDANNLLKQQEILLQEIESHLGNTVNQLEAVVKATEKEIKNVEKQIKNLENQKKAEEENLKQRTKSIDDTIDGLKEEKEQVEKVKEGLEEQLDILEKQKDALEEIIDSYSTAVNAIEDVVNGEIDSLEQQRKALEDNYNSQIENLKAIENQKDKENDLLEKQIAMQQKLNDLEEARRKKTVRTYSAEQGWTYEVDRDAVAKAESEYESAKKAYEEERHKQEFDANIKAIEDERDAALEAFDVEIKAYEEYLTSWKEILEEETKAEEQRIAQQLLGLDWREKIKKKDSQLLKTFSNDLSTYNTQLKNLVNVEIANLKASIEQKNKEVKAIEEQISAQNKLKESIEKESKAITDALDAQIQPLNDYKNTLNETLNNAQNEINEFNGMMWTMRDTVNESINQMNNKVDEFEHKMWEQMNKAKLWTGEFAEKFEEVFGHDWGSGLVNNAIENLRNKFRDMGIQGFANGGTVSYTGVAQVHGTPTSAETVFNASQSKSLYNMVKSGDFARLVAEKAVQGINLSATGSTNNNSKTININGMTIKADNPQQFHSQFMYEIGKYWDVKLTESKVYDI